MTRWTLLSVLAIGLGTGLGWNAAASLAVPDPSDDTATPIKHVIVIFQENCSFDHYFATYPHAANPPGEPHFHAAPDTPAVNGLSPGLLSHNPNSANPFRFPRSHFVTGGNSNDMKLEQSAYDGGLMDKFVEFTGTHDKGFSPSDVMGYFDGNTVTALWNYAQHFGISDNHFGTVSGATILGHINLISGQTHGAVGYDLSDPGTLKETLPDNPPYNLWMGTIVANTPSKYEGWAAAATKKTQRVFMTGKNVGDLLRAKGVTWGWFSGGFAPDQFGNPNTTDYGINREPFQLYESTANPNHTPPLNVMEVGYDGQANHQYDLDRDFWAAADIHRLPAVSFIKAPNFETGHPGTDSNPLDEQTFFVKTLNRLQKLPEWKHTAVLIGWDDSDGWYDHQMPPIVNQSKSPLDALPGLGSNPATIMGPPQHPYQARAGYGPRLPFVVISPFAKRNYVDHTITDQSSILRFIEDNWKLGRIGDFSFDARAGSLLGFFDFKRGARRDRLILDPKTGEVVSSGPPDDDDSK